VKHWLNGMFRGLLSKPLALNAWSLADRIPWMIVLVKTAAHTLHCERVEGRKWKVRFRVGVASEGISWNRGSLEFWGRNCECWGISGTLMRAGRDSTFRGICTERRSAA